MFTCNDSSRVFGNSTAAAWSCNCHAATGAASVYSSLGCPAPCPAPPTSNITRSQGLCAARRHSPYLTDEPRSGVYQQLLGSCSRSRPLWSLITAVRLPCHQNTTASPVIACGWWWHRQPDSVACAYCMCPQQTHNACLGVPLTLLVQVCMPCLLLLRYRGAAGGPAHDQRQQQQQ